MAQGNIIDEIQDIGGNDHIISPLAENVRYAGTAIKPNGDEVNFGNAKQAIDYLLEKGSSAVGSTDVGIQVLPLGKFGIASSGTYSGWVVQKDVVCPSSHGATYTFKLPDDIVAIVGQKTDKSGYTYSNEIANGDSFTFEKSSNVQRIYFAKKVGGSVALGLTSEQVENLISAGDIQVTYSDFDVNVNNVAKEALIAWAKSTPTSSRNHSFPEPFYKKAVICHISDTHGDITRLSNALKFAKFHGCDDVVHTGDAVLYQTEGISHVFEMARQVGQHITYCYGNHESYSASGRSNYQPLLAAYGADNGYNADSETATDTTYYYHDIPDKKIRIIALDLYEGSGYNGSYVGGSAEYSWNCNLSKTQIDWLISTLQSTPNNYGIVIAMHQVEGRYSDYPTKSKYSTPSYVKTSNPAAADDFDWSKFFSSINNTWETGQFVFGRPIVDIIDAFIRRTSIDKSYYRQADDNAEPVERLQVDADFSYVDSSVSFVCYLVGHSHGDKIGIYNNITSRQVICMVTSGSALQTTDDTLFAFSGGDMLRYGKGVAQDAFNLIGIDLEAKTLRIVRIGSDLTYTLAKRDYIEVSFAQPET